MAASSHEVIFSYVNGMSFDEFTQDRKTYSAVIREFEIVWNTIKDDLPTLHNVIKSVNDIQ